MGKAQSKRSIDITTDPKKVSEGDEVAGKVEKIDVDQKTDAPAVNGDAAIPKEGGDEAAAGEKKETEENSENDKDLTTEKVAGSPDGGASGDAAETSKVEERSPKDLASGEDINPLADESIKSKSKKDKVKKKWSFRSISFGKKDKQKPAKSEEAVSPTSATTTPTATEAAAAPAADHAVPATNGEAENPDKTANASPASETAATDKTKHSENGSASEQKKQANGDAEKAAPAPATIEEAAQPKPAEEPATATASTTETNTATAAVTATEEVAVKESQPEPTETVTNGHGVGDGEALTNGSSNGVVESPETETAPTAENIPSNADDEQPHLNGTNGTATPPPTPVAIESEKGQPIEAFDEVKEAAVTVTSQAEEEVVAAIIQAVSSEPETETETEGFVVVAPVPPKAEVPVFSAQVARTEFVADTDTEKADVEPESVVPETSSSSPPPLPKSPPPSRVSAFVLSEEVIEDQPVQSVVPNEEDRAEIEQQAVSFVAEITEQAAGIVTENKEQEETKNESVKAVVEKNVVSDPKDEVAAPSSTLDISFSPKSDNEEEVISSPSSSLPPTDAATAEDIVATPAVEEQIAVEQESIIPKPEAKICADQKHAEKPDTTTEEQSTTKQEQTEQDTISEDAHSDNDEEIENKNDLVGNSISDLAAPITKAGGELLAELDVRPAEVEDESNNKVDLAKDLKEKNAAADVTTQEQQLPVTCE